MAANFDDTNNVEEPDVIPEETEEEEEAEAPRKSSNPLRIVLLILVILVILCVVCFLGANFMGGIPGLPGGAPPTNTPVVPTSTPGEQPFATATEELVPTSPPGEQPPATEELVPTSPPSEQPPATEELVPTSPPGEQPPATEELVPTSPPGEQPPATEEVATAEPVPVVPTEEPGGVIPTEEAPPIATTEPVPGPTVTPGPTVIATTEPVPGPTVTPGPTVITPGQPDCSNNQPPTVDIGDSYSAMMGKGQAFVNLDGSNAKDVDGVIVSYTWDFGDGSATVEKQVVLYGYSRTGSFVVKLTVTDNCGATAEDTANVSIVGPTPPAPVTATPVATGTVTLPPTGSVGTPGFCHLVMPGQTLYGIAWNYGIDVTDLAMVNGVSPYYYVLAGQGLFIPTGPIQPGPNVYQVLPGDSVESVAFQCGLQPSVLAAANGLNPGQPLTPGGWLTIPLWQW